MFVPEYQILIGNYKALQVSEVRIVSQRDTLADTAIVKLPNLKNQLANKFKAGDQVSISLGYEGYELHTEFVGYIKRIKPTIPMELECEDATYLLRKKHLEKAWKATNLKEVVSYVLQGLPITVHNSIPDVPFDSFRLDRVNAAEALQKIADDYGLVAYFRGYELYIGLAYSDKPGEAKYQTGKNIISTDLEYRTADSVKLRVVVKGISKKNEVTEVEAGDKDGETRTILKYNLTDKKALKEIAEEELKKHKFEGYSGSFNSFLLPYCTHGFTCDFNDPDFPERSGRYVIDKVETSLSTQGGRRKIHLGIKV